MNILGINAFHGDASVGLISVALIRDGELVGAVEEERLNRRKHCAGFPALAAKAVLERATPTESLACCFKTRMDVLALGNWVLTRPSA